MPDAIETKGKPPKDSGPWMVKFRSGFVSGPFTSEQIRWTDTGDDWDVVAVLPANAIPKQARPKNGSYQ